MREPTPYICDGPGCVKRKGEGNHWFTVQYFRFPDKTKRGATILEWDITAIDHPDAKHACSESCALKLISAWMSRNNKTESVSG